MLFRMLKKKYRLSARIRLQQSLLIQTLFFTLRVSKNDLDYNRYGFIVSKRIDKRAIVRNKAKRKLRSCIEKVQKKADVGNDLLFYLKKSVVQTPTRILCREIEHVLKREKILT